MLKLGVTAIAVGASVGSRVGAPITGPMVAVTCVGVTSKVGGIIVFVALACATGVHVGGIVGISGTLCISTPSVGVGVGCGVMVDVFVGAGVSV